MFVILHILSLLDVLLLNVANEPQLTNKQTWDNTISNSAGQYSCNIFGARNQNYHFNWQCW